MNWYKLSQQSVLFYPHQGSPENNSEKVRPIGIDPETQENIYECSICHKPILEEDIEDWYISDESGNSYQLPVYDKKRISQALQEISQCLLPAYNQLQKYIQESNLESKRNETYDYGFTSSLFSWEVQIPQLSSIFNKYPELKDICNYQQRYWRGSNICSLFKRSTEFNGKEIFELSEFILNPEKEIKNILEYSSQKYTINFSLPICEECSESLDKCYFCDRKIFPGEEKTEAVWGNNDYACEKCLESGRANMCIYCGKADSTKDMHDIENQGFVCDNCYEDGDAEIIEWAELKISNLNIPIGKNIPLSKKTITNLFNFIKQYNDKYGNKDLNKKEWERIYYLSKKMGVTKEGTEYLKFIEDSHNCEDILDIIDNINNNIQAQNYMKEKYPNLIYKDTPFDIGIVPNYNTSKQGFTITITPSDKFFDYAKDKYPNIRQVWDKMSYTPHHNGVLAYARCAYEMGSELVINNLQRDADSDNYQNSVNIAYPENMEVAKWIDNATKGWDTFLLDIIRSICISENINAYLTTFDQQKNKWGNLPIYKSKKTYQKTPESMGFNLENPETNLVEDRGMYSRDNQMYQIANSLNWYKKAQNKEYPFNDPPEWDFPEADHDYNPNWDYEVINTPNNSLVLITEEVMNDINQKIIPEIGMGKAKVAYIKNDKTNAMARYVFGTAPHPVFVINLEEISKVVEENGGNIGSEIEITLVHELGHAIQDWMNMEMIEDQAEEFAQDWHYYRKIWYFWE